MTTADALGNTLDTRPLNEIPHGAFDPPLTDAERAALFDDVDPQGPNNADDCMDCHTDNGTDGRISVITGRVTRGRITEVQQIQNLPVQEQVPAGHVTLRLVSKPLAGMDVIEGVPEAAMRFVNSERRRAGIPVQGEIVKVRSLTTGRTVVAKFGWLGVDGTIEDFMFRASLNELGQGNNLVHRSQLSVFDVDPLLDPVVAIDRANGLRKAVLPSPTQRNANGQVVYRRALCGVCHIPNPYGIPGLFSDLMRHKTGTEGPLAPNGFMTPSLRMVGQRETTLGHDGRANGFDEAVSELHTTGFARTSANRWFAESAGNRADARDDMRGI